MYQLKNINNLYQVIVGIEKNWQNMSPKPMVSLNLISVSRKPVTKLQNYFVMSEVLPENFKNSLQMINLEK